LINNGTADYVGYIDRGQIGYARANYAHTGSGRLYICYDHAYGGAAGLILHSRDDRAGVVFIGSSCNYQSARQPQNYITAVCCLG
jgi:hypothetical protein